MTRDSNGVWRRCSKLKSCTEQGLHPGKITLLCHAHLRDGGAYSSFCDQTGGDKPAAESMGLTSRLTFNH